MISNFSNQPKTIQTVDRGRTLQIIQLGLEVKAYRFSRQTALTWLSTFPGDLEIEHYYAKALILEGRNPQAEQVLVKILKFDPEYIGAWQTLFELVKGSNPNLSVKCAGMLQALGVSTPGFTDLPDWGLRLQMVRQSIQGGQDSAAQTLLLTQMGIPDHPELVDILHLQIISKLSDAATVLNLARLYHLRWPDCLQFSLMLVKAWMDSGNEDEAVKLLHFCAAKDSIGQVPDRLWGSDYLYKPMYPQNMEISADLCIPAEVAGRLGLNQLVAGTIPQSVNITNGKLSQASSFDGYKLIATEKSAYPDHPKIDEKLVKQKNATILEVEAEFKKVAENIKQPMLSNSDNRFPAYVILSTKIGLEQQFGAQSARVILEELKKLSQSIRDKNGWSSFVFLPDDLEICGKYGITPVNSLDPWKIKLALVDLDKSLQKSGERIGSVLIVGGDAVVPFHKLPNPTEDGDAEVPSDNPYGSLNSDYYISDWPVGRLPGEDGSDTGLLLTQLRNTTQYHLDSGEAKTWLNQIFRIILFWNKPWMKHFGNIGYTASVWRRSSLSVFRSIGDGKNLFLSPDDPQKNFDAKKISEAPLAYFNLHGVEDGSDWYGQRDPLEKVPGPDFPVALSPADLHKNAKTPAIVYSEACYGGHIFGKSEDQSIALTLMGMGVLAMIGSTTISYGSVTTPLIGADLLGYLIMKNLKDGLTVGSSMTKAKVDFVREMNRRQGYLDGEDQKTLISFVLFGDPLVAYDPYQAMSKSYAVDSVRPVIKTVCDRTEMSIENDPVATKMVLQAKALVKDYLPGLDYAEVKINQQSARLQKSITVGNKDSNYSQPNRVVVSFSKQISQAEKVHRQYARVTLDQQGKMIKLAVSR
jgi:hypothetical protein